MNFRFQNQDLKDLYTKGDGKGQYPESVVRSFFKKIQSIKHANHEGDLRAIKGNHFEKIKGTDYYSIRINDQFRLEFSFVEEDGCKKILIKEISNHYK